MLATNVVLEPILVALSKLLITSMCYLDFIVYATSHIRYAFTITYLLGEPEPVS